MENTTLIDSPVLSDCHPPTYEKVRKNRMSLFFMDLAQIVCQCGVTCQRRSNTCSAAEVDSL
jgi:hypothetical protein